jgi:hypothetical protein
VSRRGDWAENQVDAIEVTGILTEVGALIALLVGAWTEAGVAKVTHET